MESKYQLEITPKTRILNQFRKLLRFGVFERLLRRKTEGKPDQSFWVRLIPPNYLYPENSRRNVERDGIKYSVDISDLMEHAVYFGYSEAAIERLFGLAKDKNTIIDVGVNVGFTLLNFAKLSPRGRVIGFEPDLRNFRKAQKNVSLNSFDNIEIFKKGLGAERATSRLFKVNEQNAGMNRILVDDLSFADEFAYEEIEVIKLDDFAVEHSLSQIDLIKIDVEGYELNVLKGAEKSLRTLTPTLFIELDDNNLRDQNASAQSLVLFLESLGYGISRADNDLPVKSSDDFGNCHFDIVCECN